MPTPLRSNPMTPTNLLRIELAVLALGIFLLDSLTSVDIIIPILYVNVVFLSMWCGRIADVVAAGVGSAVLTVFSFLLTIVGHRLLGPAFVNCILSLSAIACVTVLGARNIRMHALLRRDRLRIDRVSRGISMKEVTASIVHEVTQPLTAIGANAGAANRWLDLSPPNLLEAGAATRRIVAEVDRASAVVTRLRTLVSGSPLATSRCQVTTIVAGAIDHLQHEIREARVEVSVTCAKGLHVEADRVLLQQVVINTLANAIDALVAAKVEHPEVRIGATAARGRVILAIEDDGVGVDAEMLERIFDSFYTTKANGGGMGIGLSVSRSIIEAHGGSIQARRNEPRGLVVEVALPSCEPLVEPR